MPNKLDYRLLTHNDGELLFKFNSSIENLAYVPRTPYTTIDEAEVLLSRFIKSMDDKSAIWWAVSCKGSGSLVGYGGLFNIDSDNHRAEIGYGFLKEFWGKGYASSIVDFITNYGFTELNLHRICGLVDPLNAASIRVLEKNGYAKEGVMRDYYYARGRYFDMCLLAKVKIQEEHA